jgi:DNA-binding NtrC family response regulator
MPLQTVPLPRAGGRALVVEDHLPLNNMISEALRSDGLEVDQAADGRRAREMLRGGGYQVAVIDIRMPGLTGFELLEWASSEVPGCAVIMMSVVADPESRRRAATLGAVGFHQKPFALETLMGSVRSAFDVAEPMI